MDKRKHPRFPVEFPVLITGELGEGTGKALNLSREGCLIESDLSAHEGAYVELKVKLPGDQPPLAIELAAVRWVSGRVFGLMFLFMSPDEHDKLLALIGELESQFVEEHP